MVFPGETSKRNSAMLLLYRAIGRTRHYHVRGRNCTIDVIALYQVFHRIVLDTAL